MTGIIHVSQPATKISAIFPQHDTVMIPIISLSFLILSTALSYHQIFVVTENSMFIVP